MISIINIKIKNTAISMINCLEKNYAEFYWRNFFVALSSKYYVCIYGKFTFRSKKNKKIFKNIVIK